MAVPVGGHALRAAVTAGEWPYGQVTPIDSQIRKMESNGAYRASRAIAWF